MQQLHKDLTLIFHKNNNWAVKIFFKYMPVNKLYYKLLIHFVNTVYYCLSRLSH